MGVAVTGDAGSKGATVGWAVAETRGTGLAVLTHIPLRTRAHLNPVGRHTVQPSAGRLQAHIIQEASAWGRTSTGMNIIS